MADQSPREIVSGLGFIEGPVWMEDGALLVCDMCEQGILAVDLERGTASPFVNTGGGPNGLAIGPDGDLFVCNNGGMAFGPKVDGQNKPVGGGAKPDNAIAPCIQKVDRKGRVETLYAECGGHPLQAPNDLVFDAHGGFYFTDIGHAHGRTCDLGGLYYAKADGSLIRELIHDATPTTPLTQPNGVALSPDGKTIYVAETGSGRLWAWSVLEPGVLGPAPSPVSRNGAAMLFGWGDYTLFDSMAVDSVGNICVGTLLRGGVTVVRPEGGLERFIAIPEEYYVTNICFGGADLKTAYLTASGHGKVWAVDWPHSGLALAHVASTPRLAA